MTVQSGPDEVVALAVSPARPWFGRVAVGASVLGVAFACGSIAPPPPAPVPPTFRAERCAAAEPDPICLAVLPADLRATPTPERYRDGLASDVAREVELPTDGSLLPGRVVSLTAVPSDLETQAQVAVNQAVDRLDPWTGLRQWAGRGAPDVTEVAALRDWTRPAPPLPPLRRPADLQAAGLSATEVDVATWSARYNGFARAALDRATADAAWRYGEARREAIRAAWAGLEAREQRQFTEAQARRAAAEQNTLTLSWLTAASALVGLLLAAGWMRRQPLVVRVSPHQLQLGALTVPWSDAWSARPPRIETWDGPVTLAGRELSDEAVAALRAATDRAVERRRHLQPMDREALAALAKLRE